VSNLDIAQQPSNMELAMVSTVTIFENSGVIKIDEVSFAPEWISDIRIEGGHPNGPVFAYNGARAVLSDQGADQLVAAGATDNR
jgi:hypothetical protein